MAFGAIGSVLIILLATVLLISGMVMDDWVVANGNTIGPFRSCQMRNCKIEIPGNDYLRASSWLLVCSLIANSGSLIMSVVSLCLGKTLRRNCLNPMIVLSAVAGICSFAGLLVWMGRFASLHIPKSAYGNGWSLVPLSIICSWVHIAVCVFLYKEYKPKQSSHHRNHAKGKLGSPGVTGFTNEVMHSDTYNQDNVTTHEAEMSNQMETNNYLNVTSEHQAETTLSYHHNISSYQDEEAHNRITDFSPEYENQDQIIDRHEVETNPDRGENEWSTFTSGSVLESQELHTDETNNNIKNENAIGHQDIPGVNDGNLPETSEEVHHYPDPDDQITQWDDNIPAVPAPPPLAGIQ